MNEGIADVRFALIAYAGLSEIEALRDGDGDARRAWGVFEDRLREAGVLRGSHMVGPSYLATTVRDHDGRHRVQHGPHDGERDEDAPQLCGVFLINAPDRECAIAWAARCPAATASGAVEVRRVGSRERVITIHHLAASPRVRRIRPRRREQTLRAVGTELELPGRSSASGAAIGDRRREVCVDRVRGPAGERELEAPAVVTASEPPEEKPS